jgi:hypothetical protein
MTVNVGDRATFNSERLPEDRLIDCPETGPGETHSWREHFDGVTGVVDALGVGAEDGLVRIRGLAHGHPYTAWVEAGWLDIHDPAEVE